MNPMPVAPPPVLIEPADIAGPTARGLIEELNAELLTLYPEPGATHFTLDPGEVAGGNGVFLIARAGETLGCAALRVLEPGVGEIKRMYVRPEARGRRTGRALLGAVEDEARRLGVHRLVLETGALQVAAMALYRRAGFYEMPRFGEYVDSPASICLARDL